MGAALGLGFAAGLPLLLTSSTLSARLAAAGVDLGSIGLYSLVGLPYSLKFLWAPLLDRLPPPLRRPAGRRGWIAPLQVLLAIAVAALGAADPRSGLPLAGLALLVAFLSASQDVVIDAYRAEALPPPSRAAGGATYVLGYRAAMVAAGAGALLLSERLPWPAVYGAVGVLMLLALPVTLTAPREPAAVGDDLPKTSIAAGEAAQEDAPLDELPRTKGTEPSARPAPGAGEACSWKVVPAGLARETCFWKVVPAGRGLLGVVLLYKLGDALVLGMLTPCLLQLGFSAGEVGALASGAGLGATIVGALLGGALTPRLGLRRALLLFGAAQAAANLGYAALAVTPSRPLLLGAVVLDNACGGLATTAFVALLASLCERGRSATQYAVLSSLSSVAGRLAGAVAGYLAAGLGWPRFFLLTALLGAPALALLRWGGASGPSEKTEPL